MHVKQAIKILLPREYISRSSQKRHWASKYPRKSAFKSKPRHISILQCCLEGCPEKEEVSDWQGQENSVNKRWF